MRGKRRRRESPPFRYAFSFTHALANSANYRAAGPVSTLPMVSAMVR